MNEAPAINAIRDSHPVDAGSVSSQIGQKANFLVSFSAYIDKESGANSYKTHIQLRKNVC